MIDRLSVSHILGKWTTGKLERLSVPAPAFTLVSSKTIKSCRSGVVLKGCESVGITLFSDLDPFTLMRIGIRILLPVFLDPNPDSPGSLFIWRSWIRIRIGNGDPDLDPGAWKLTKIYK